jgi:hypothetical protein
MERASSRFWLRKTKKPTDGVDGPLEAAKKEAGAKGQNLRLRPPTKAAYL